MSEETASRATAVAVTRQRKASVGRQWTLCFWVLMAWGMPTFGQPDGGFVLSGTVAGVKRGEMWLTVFENRERTTKAHVRGGEFEFRGNVKRPTMAALRMGKRGTPLFFVLENSRVSVTFRPTTPTASPISGSRANSRYRFALERCGEEENGEDCIVEFAHDNREETFVPFLYYTCLSGERLVEEGAFIDSLPEAVREVYHFGLLQQRRQRATATAVGQKIPDFIFYNQERQTVHFDSIRATGRGTLLVFIPSWHEAFNEYVDSLQEQLKETKLVVVRTDAHPAGWDADYMSELDIDHLPYLILIDLEGRIVARNVRRWEAVRLTTEMNRGNLTATENFSTKENESTTREKQ